MEDNIGATCAGETKFDISDDGIQRVCAESGFPIVKHGDVIVLTTDFIFCKHKIKVAVMGVASCANKECDRNRCYLYGGEKVGLWVYDEERINQFILPEISSFKLLNT